MLADECGPAIADNSDAFVPTDALELAAPFRSGALERVEHSIWAVNPLFVVVDLHAQPPARERVVGVATYSDRASIFHRHQHRAGVWAIMWACCANHRLPLRSVRHFLLPALCACAVLRASRSALGAAEKSLLRLQLAMTVRSSADPARIPLRAVLGKC